MAITNIERLPAEAGVGPLHTLWDQQPSRARFWSLLVASVVFCLAYAPNFRELLASWNDDPNYSHGYLVIPIALFILWQRLSEPVGAQAPETKRTRSTRALPAPLLGKAQAPAADAVPTSSSILSPWWGWFGLILIMIARAVAYERNLHWVETATILPAIVCLAWSFGGPALLRRIWPAIAFLVFMLPLPEATNDYLALPLQRMAATGSAFLLQLTGMWVIQDGNVINLRTPHGMSRLDVALACNGLRMLMTMAATITATIILIPLPTWKRVVLLLSVVPIALVCNMIRIMATGWAYYFMESNASHEWAHDMSGWLMMPLALLLVLAELGILGWLVPADESPADETKVTLPMLTYKKR